MMKICILTLIIMLLPVLGFATELKKDTEIIIVGTVHKPTKNYSISSLKDILNFLSPDVILFEHPTDWYNEKYIDRLIKISKENSKISQEAEAILSFRINKPNVIIRPYDIKGRNEYYKKNGYFEKEEKFSNIISKLAESPKCKEYCQLLIQQDVTNSNIKMAFGKDFPRVINSKAVDDFFQNSLVTMYKNYFVLTNFIEEKKLFQDFLILHQNYWEKRNNVMVKNIIKYSKEFKGKKIVILTGAEHRGSLLKLLGVQKEKENIEIKEYWQ